MKLSNHKLVWLRALHSPCLTASSKAAVFHMHHDVATRMLIVVQSLWFGMDLWYAWAAGAGTPPYRKIFLD